MIRVFTSCSDLRKFGTVKAFKELYRLTESGSKQMVLYIAPSSVTKKFYEFNLEPNKELEDRDCTITEFLTSTDRSSILHSDGTALISAELEHTDYRSATTAQIFKVTEITKVEVNDDDECIYLGIKTPASIQKTFKVEAPMTPIEALVEAKVSKLNKEDKSAIPKMTPITKSEIEGLNIGQLNGANWEE